MKLKLANVRLSFPDLFTAVQFNGQGPFSYRAAFLIDPKSSNAATVRAAVDAVAKEKWGAKAAAVLKTIEGNPQKCCYYSGDVKEYNGYAGNMVLSTTRNQDKGRPLIINADKTPLQLEDGKPYAGCYVNATVELWAQDNGHGKGIRATLLGLQFYKDGDAFGAGAAPNVDDFEDLSAEEFADDLA